MKFRGILEATFNRQPPHSAYAELEEVIRYLNEEYLKRGAKSAEDAATIVNWRIEDSKLIMYLETGRSVRIDEAALRIRNVISQRLGSKYRLGIRQLRLINSVIEIDGEVRVSLKLPMIKSIDYVNGKTIITLNDLNESDIKKPLFLRLLRLIQEKEARLRWGGKAEHWILLKQSRIKFEKPLFTEDPNKVLEEIGWIKRMSIGQWLYTPPFTYLLNMIRNLFIEEVLKPLGFVEATFPKMYPLDVGLKTGHLKGVINSMLFVSLPKSYNIAEFEELIDYMYVTNEAPGEEVQRYLRPPTYFLCFAQCEPFYWFFENEVLDDSVLPIKWYDMSGPSYRWEAGGLHGIERVIEFHRIEVVWLGKPEQVIDIRNQLLERYERFMDNVLDLEWRWVWVTPWFYEQSGVSEAVELDINRPGTIDFEAWLPYRGPRENKKAWLEIGNISIHGTKFTAPFKIKHSRGDTLWTGCSGFGSERWLIAFLAQHGFDPSNWPPKLVEYIEKNPIPEALNTVTYPKTRSGKELLENIMKLYRR